jgi:hypothetical protein
MVPALNEPLFFPGCLFIECGYIGCQPILGLLLSKGRRDAANALASMGEETVGFNFSFSFGLNRIRALKNDPVGLRQSSPVLSIIAAVLTVLPQKQKVCQFGTGGILDRLVLFSYVPNSSWSRHFSPRRTPAITGPL